MNSIIENTLYHLTSQRRFDEISEDQISKIATEYPFFAPSQLLYSLKLKNEVNYKTPSQIHKTALFFNNPEWLSFHLQNDQILAFEVPQFNTINTAEEVSKENIADEDVSIEHKSSDNQHFQHIDIPTLQDVKDIMTGTTFTAPEAEQLENNFQNEFEPVAAKSDSSTDTDHVLSEVTSAEQEIDEYDTAFTDEQENDFENTREIEDFAISIPQSISNQLADAKAGMSKHLSGDALDINYNNEPAHAVDYFDSQGIKLDLSKLPQDRLTRQLLKFTDWLKHVKTANPNPKDLGTEPELETKVEYSAKNSNDSREINTETMAEVYAKQGKLEKAIQIYIKLSFLNPDKTAFFAKKIQELKGI